MNASTQQFAQQRTYFVILFEARSGSTYLTEALDSHPQVRAIKEPLVGFKKRLDRGQEEADAQLKWAQQFFSTALDGGCRAAGFKTKLWTVHDRDEFARLLKEERPKLILLTRRNRIKKVVSFINAMRLHDATADWNLYDSEQRLSPFRIEVSEFCELLEKHERNNQRLVAFVDNLQMPILRLFYEDVVCDWERTLERICSWLDVAYVPLTGHCVKNTSDNLRDVVVNLDELRSQFQGTSYESMFDEVLDGT